MGGISISDLYWIGIKCRESKSKKLFGREKICSISNVRCSKSSIGKNFQLTFDVMETPHNVNDPK